MPALTLAAVVLSLGVADDRTIGEREFLTLLGRDCPIVRLWPPGKVPDEPRPIPAEAVRTEDPMRGRTHQLRIENVTDPSMIIISPPADKNRGIALVLAPGGGYGGLATESHVATAQVMNEFGITLVILKYRVPKRHEGYPINHQPLQDAQRAMSLLRSRAKDWGIDPGRICFGGVSAGGHLAASLAINHTQRWYAPIDEVDAVSCRPDCAVLLKPAYLTDPILSRTRDPHLHYERINANDTPPTFIAINRPDKFTIGATELALALMDANVPSELHVYPEGGHGEPLETYPFGDWFREWVRFLGDHGLLSTPDRPSRPRPAPFRLEQVAATNRETTADAILKTMLGKNAVVMPIWPNGTGPDDGTDWPDEIVEISPKRPDVLLVRNVSRPSITIVKPPPENDTGRAVIVCPGGGYSALAARSEGTRICDWLRASPPSF